METHGTGTELGDPIEIGALAATMGQGRTKRCKLVLGAVKTNISHLEGAAGIAGMIKLIEALRLRGVPPNLHFQELNHHIETGALNAVFPSDVATLPDQVAAPTAGLSSFGFGGTNTHAAFGAPEDDPAENPEAVGLPVEFRRQKFAWGGVRHPLLAQPRQGTEPGLQVFASPIRGKVVLLLSHHIIYGEVVVPGATYLETVIATAAFRLGYNGQKFAIKGVGFQSPLVLRPVGDTLPEPLELILHIYDSGRWSMNSGVGGRITATHAEGSLALEGAAEAIVMDLEQIRSRCPEEVADERMYVPFANIGLPLQPRFRTVRSILRSSDEIIAWVSGEQDGTNAGFLFGPAVIDGSFQASCAFQDLEALPSLRIPLSINKLTIYGQGFSPDVWVHHKLLENSDKQMTTDVVLAGHDQKVLLTMDKMRLREVRPEHIAKMLAQSAGDADNDLLEVEWSALDLKGAKASASLGPVLFVGASEDLKGSLAARFPDCTFGYADDAGNMKSVYVGALNEAAPELDVLHEAMTMAQKATATIAGKKGQAPSMWWITRGTMAAGTGGSCCKHAGLWGMARTVRLEAQSLPHRCLDLDDAHGTPEEVATALAHWLGQLTSCEQEPEVAVRVSDAGDEPRAFVSRLVRSAVLPRGSSRLQMSSRGSLSNLRPVQGCQRRKPQETEAEIRVRAVGLNFRDVLNVMASTLATLDLREPTRPALSLPSEAGSRTCGQAPTSSASLQAV
jgi:hypothetical protein